MRQLLGTCLQNAHARGFTSIAFPAIGTGNLMVPRDVACRVMYDEVARFSQTVGKTSVTDVRFVVYDKDHISVNVRYFV